MDPPNDPYEGSGDDLDDGLEGSGGCDDEDDEDCQSKMVPTIRRHGSLEKRESEFKLFMIKSAN